VGAERGPYNWVLLEPPKLTLHNAGYGGLEEMKEWLPTDKVLFGALRLSFGGPQGRMNRNGNDFTVGRTISTGLTKHVLIHWVGPKVSAVRRGLANSKWQQAASLISQSCTVTFRREAHDLRDLELDHMVCELRRLTVVDSFGVNGALANRINTEEYIAVLEEELRERRRSVKSEPAEVEEPKRELPDPRTAVEAVRAASGAWNWVLLGCQKTSALPPSQFPSPCRALY